MQKMDSLQISSMKFEHRVCAILAKMELE